MLQLAAGSALRLVDLLRLARAELKAAEILEAETDAQLLVEHFAGVTRLERISDPGREIPEPHVDMIQTALSRRKAGEPVHRILGYREFYGLRLTLSAETLEPRPDTEALVDVLLPILRQMQAPRILDLGTGTGAISLALLSQLPEATAVGVDIAADAVVTARGNAEQLGFGDRFDARRSDWFETIHDVFHAIVANPPYIRSNVIAQLTREVREHDPLRALDGGPDGLEPYRVIAAQSSRHLNPAGIVAVEIGFDQFDEVDNLFSQAGFRLIEVGLDLNGHRRALVFQRVATERLEQSAWQSA